MRSFPLTRIFAVPQLSRSGPIFREPHLTFARFSPLPRSRPEGAVWQVADQNLPGFSISPGMRQRGR